MEKKMHNAKLDIETITPEMFQDEQRKKDSVALAGHIRKLTYMMEHLPMYLKHLQEIYVSQLENYIQAERTEQGIDD